MQPFQWDPPPQLQETHRTTHTGTTTRCKTHRRNNSHMKRPQPQPPHRRGTLHRRLQPLYTEKHKVSCSGFLPNTKLMHIMQPFQCDLPPQLQETHRSTQTGTTTRCKTHRRNNSRMKRPQPQPPHRRGTFHRRLQPLLTEKHKVSCSGFLPNTKAMQHSCSHSNAICHHSFKKRIEVRTQEQPLVSKHIGGTIRDRNDRSRNRRTDEVPFIAGCTHFTRKKTRFRAPACSPTQSPCNIIQPFQCNLPPHLQETHRTTQTGTTLVAKHIGGTICDRNDRSRNRRTDEVPFIAGCSHF